MIFALVLVALDALNVFVAIACQSTVISVGMIMLQPKTSWLGVAWSIVWMVLQSAKAVTWRR